MTNAPASPPQEFPSMKEVIAEATTTCKEAGRWSGVLFSDKYPGFRIEIHCRSGVPYNIVVIREKS